MPRNAAKRGANGTGSIRERTRTKKDGKKTKYWEARITVGFDPGTGKQIQRTVTGRTQKEVREKMQEIAVDINNDAYQPPCKLSVGEWLDKWVETYTLNCKPRTISIYKSDIRLHIKPAIGAIRLEALNAHTIQDFYNSLTRGSTKRKPLSAKSVRGVHGVLHKALKQAVLNGYLRHNPSDSCTLPRRRKPEIHPFTESEVAAFLKAIEGHRFEELFVTTLFSGVREVEILGLTWNHIDFRQDKILITQQMQLHQEEGVKGYVLDSTKNDRGRAVTVAPTVMSALRQRKLKQTEDRLLAGAAWENEMNLVFTNELGRYLTKPTVYRAFKKVAASIGRPDARFHDLRHSYATAALRSGDDIKTVQNALGHATAAFTLDVYGHVTEEMQRESAARMDAYIKTVSQ